MASSTTASLGPLTTIFTPPSDCFMDSPETWTNCGRGAGAAVTDTFTFCFWLLPTSCFPPKPSVVSLDLNGFSNFGEVYYYSPGVLPSAYVTQNVSGVGYPLTTTVDGCLS